MRHAWSFINGSGVLVIARKLYEEDRWVGGSPCNIPGFECKTHVNSADTVSHKSSHGRTDTAQILVHKFCIEQTR